MRICIRTHVNSNWHEIEEQFNETLFLKLNPPLPKVQLIRFDGCKKGDVVEMELNFGLWKDQWISDITFNNRTEQGFEFIDKGSKLPFPFKYWKHHHIIQKSEKGTVIIDDITYRSLNRLVTLLMYPLLYLQFLYRRPIYKRTFSKP